MYPELQLLIDGDWRGTQGRDTLAVHNPATGVLLGQLPVASAADIDDAIDAADRAFDGWRRRTALDRAGILQAVAAALRAQNAGLARILTQEQGKTLTEAVGEILSCADTFDWMAEEGRRIYGRVVPSRFAGMEQLVLREPVGPVAAFSPWNYPAALACRKIATALAAGCTLVLKPAEEAPGVLVAIARLCVEAGVPAGVLNLVFGVPDMISRQTIAAPQIRKLSFTGSVSVGRHLATLAAGQLKKITLELGGHSPVIVMDDANVRQVATLAAAAKFRNAGQICFSPTRFFVHERVHAAFVDAFVERATALQVGNGLDDGVQMGPLINARRVAAMQALVDDAVAHGARVRCGGIPMAELPHGHYWAPTLIEVEDPCIRAMREEPFGPIALIKPFARLDDAIAQANASEYGLGAFAFTGSLSVAARLQAELQAGNVSLNTFAMTPAELPFSGIKHSGLGTEMGSEGLQEHLHTKSVLRAVF